MPGGDRPSRDGYSRHGRGCCGARTAGGDVMNDTTMASTSPGASQSSSPASAAECPNCHAPVEDPWCSKCGQKQSDLDPTWHDLLHETLHEFCIWTVRFSARHGSCF